MFDRDFELKGKHAQYTKFLVNSAKIFKRYMDVYMVGAIIGFLHGRQEKIDQSIADDARIFAEVFNKERSRLEFFYQLIMLLDESTGLDEQQRIDRAFRVTDAAQEAMQANMELFHSYVFGGIEVLYEKLAEDSTTIDDYINQVYQVVEAFKNDIDGKHDELIQKEFHT